MGKGKKEELNTQTKELKKNEEDDRQLLFVNLYDTKGRRLKRVKS